MEPLYAGLLAWLIELSVAGVAFYLLRREENKVYRRREDDKTRKS